MKWTLPVLAVALLSSVLAAEGRAQAPCPCNANGPVAGSVVAGGATGTVVTGGVVGSSIVSQDIVVTGTPIVLGGSVVSSSPIGTPVVATGATVGQVLPYSYSVALPNPARVYVEYGAADQFPYHGRAYGNPGDRWSWYYMGGGDRRYLAKYYYPLLP